MPENRKYFPHKSILLISTRTEEGLPLPPNHIINTILEGILAEAQTRYPVRICHHLFMANHLHMILVVENAQDVPNFMRYLKSESSHAVNRLLGRSKKTIWSEGYDSPILATPEKVIHYIKYIYLNPSRAHLEDEIDRYPGVSSWKMFKEKRHLSHHARIPRPLLKPLASPALSINEQKRIVSEWERMELPKARFALSPWAWAECFEGIDIDSTRERILREISEEEAISRAERKRDGKQIVGATALRRQSMLKEHVPQKRSRRVIVISEDKELRKRFIEHFRALCGLAMDAYKNWKRGDLRPKIPPGLFAPSVPYLASALPV